MRIAAFGRRSTLVDRGANEWVPELDPQAVDAHEVGVLGTDKVVGVGAQQAARALDTSDLA